MSFSPTPEQVAIVEAVKASTESIMISALAGAAKTTTLQLICEALPPQPILSLAFNKRIAVEMEKRLPGHVKCQTLNSLGHRVWGTAVGKRLVLDTGKIYNIVKGKVDALKQRDKSEAYEVFSELLQTVRAARVAGYIPEGKFPQAKRLVDHDEFWITTNQNSFEDFTTLMQDLVEESLFECIQQSYKGMIDFDDQIYMPALFGGQFPKFPRLLVDEYQDLSPLNHEMLRKLFAGCLIGVGDPFQSIYGFRGAVQSGMARSTAEFSMREMSLSTSFRCPIEVVKLARERAPHMQYPDWAKPGSVTYLDEWGPQNIPDGAAVICRNNAPLFKLAIQLLASGRGINLVGRDIGPALIKVLKKLGDLHMPSSEVLNAIDNWETDQLRKSKNAAGTHDRAECLRVFAVTGPDLGAAIAYAEGIFKAEGPVQLLSGHKSKGLEWESVIHLDPWRVPSRFAESPEALEQEANLKYVITTRSKDSLTFANLDKFDGVF